MVLDIVCSKTARLYVDHQKHTPLPYYKSQSLTIIQLTNPCIYYSLGYYLNGQMPCMQSILLDNILIHFWVGTLFWYVLHLCVYKIENFHTFICSELHVIRDLSFAIQPGDPQVGPHSLICKRVPISLTIFCQWLRHFVYLLQGRL